MLTKKIETAVLPVVEEACGEMEGLAPADAMRDMLMQGLAERPLAGGFRSIAEVILQGGEPAMETCLRNLGDVAYNRWMPFVAEGLSPFAAESCRSRQILIEGLKRARRDMEMPEADLPCDQWERVFTEAFARCLWAKAFADWTERNHPERMRSGMEWLDEAPPTTPEARDAALVHLGRLLECNSVPAGVFLVLNAMRADGWYDSADRCDGHNIPLRSAATGYVRSLGHYMMLSCLGEGASWFDDHEEFDIEFPEIEADYKELGGWEDG